MFDDDFLIHPVHGGQRNVPSFLLNRLQEKHKPAKVVNWEVTTVILPTTDPRQDLEMLTTVVAEFEDIRTEDCSKSYALSPE